MFYRVILRVPAGLTAELLTTEQRAAIDSVFGQFVDPMPGTIVANGLKVIDAVTTDSFNPQAMAALGLDWEVLGLWDQTGQPVDGLTLKASVFLEHLPARQDYDQDGKPSGEPIAPVLHEPHRWAGWPACF